MTANSEIKIEFAPGCFDSFDGTQEELDELIKIITDTFKNASPEELEEIGTPLEEVWDDLDDETKESIMTNYTSLDEPDKRKLN